MIKIDVGAANAKINDSDNIHLLFEPSTDDYIKLCCKYVNLPNVFVFDNALWDKKEHLLLNICKKQECSSVFEPDKQVISSFTGQWSNTDRFEIVKKVPTMAHPLKDILDTIIPQLKTMGMSEEELKISELKIDTQGSEYEILLGMGDYLNDVQQLICEVEFEPIYKGQKLFKDVKQHVHNYGLEFIKHKREVSWGRPVFADAIFERVK
tara:strand:+ start:273 stop:899 length:627 start_codon:yes stop_codon:yes gene_type:complete